jgi:hypothetical protein
MGPLFDHYREPERNCRVRPCTTKEWFFYWLRWYVAGRVFEWYCATNMFFQGVQIFFYPDSVGKSAFKYLALPWGVLCSILLLSGVARIVALFVNGRSLHYGPHVRIAGCLLGSFIWTQMTIALFVLSFDTGFPSPGIPNWGLLAVWELAAAYQAGTDVKRRNS